MNVHYVVVLHNAGSGRRGIPMAIRNAMTGTRFPIVPKRPIASVNTERCHDSMGLTSRCVRCGSQI